MLDIPVIWNWEEKHKGEKKKKAFPSDEDSSFQVLIIPENTYQKDILSCPNWNGGTGNEQPLTHPPRETHEKLLLLGPITR